MKKPAVLILALSLFASLTSAAGISPVLQIKTLRVITGDTRVFFTSNSTSFHAGRVWVFDGTTVTGKNMLTVLLASKTSGLPLTFTEGDQLQAGLDWYWATDAILQ